MATRLTLEKLIEAANRLKPQERERLIRTLRRKSHKPRHHITELKGLGKEVWQGVDAQKYINAERDSWER